MTVLPSRTWRESFGDPRDKVVLPPFMGPPSDGDACHGEDSGFTALSDTDGVTGTDSGVLLFFDLDRSGAGADLELTAWPGDSDGVSTHLGAGENGGWSGPLADTEAGHGTDGPTPVTFIKTETDSSGPETDTGPGASGTIELIDVYTFQPLFRWTGGFFSLTLPAKPVAEKIDEIREFTLWTGERPDGNAYRLYAAFAAGQLHFVSATDACTAREEGEAASLQVTVHIAPALTVGLAVS